MFCFVPNQLFFIDSVDPALWLRGMLTLGGSNPSCFFPRQKICKTSVEVAFTAFVSCNVVLLMYLITTKRTIQVLRKSCLGILFVGIPDNLWWGLKINHMM
eukprot:TRINITY_DN48115_c0_g1_i3.p4 TRINITY_DN48115_c0_g1~~TRINITY_DN48115_c0_g1_i3.p4  ORF type:complete len:101 (-),score=4.34 TRINITY_DN48115_c0_g1_i3:230-532(-)